MLLSKYAAFIEPLAGLLFMFAMVTSSGEVNNQYQWDISYMYRSF
jgi:hypothetical protein